MQGTSTDEQNLIELEAYLQTASLPKKVDLVVGSSIIDVPKFIETQLNYARSDGNSPVRKLALERLLRLRAILEGQDNNTLTK